MKRLTKVPTTGLLVLSIIVVVFLYWFCCYLATCLEMSDGTSAGPILVAILQVSLTVVNIKRRHVSWKCFRDVVLMLICQDVIAIACQAPQILGIGQFLFSFFPVLLALIPAILSEFYDVDKFGIGLGICYFACGLVVLINISEIHIYREYCTFLILLQGFYLLAVKPQD